MKKVSLISFITLTTVVFYSCSTNNDYLSLKDGETNFPAHIEEYGIALANEFRQTVYNLNEMGIFYTDADNSPEFRERFYNDWYNASPTPTLSGISIQDMQIFNDPEALMEGYRNLTDIQKKFIGRIIIEYENSTSCNDYLSKLLSINKDIYTQVPEIEQERLL